MLLFIGTGVIIAGATYFGDQFGPHDVGNLLVGYAAAAASVAVGAMFVAEIISDRA